MTQTPNKRRRCTRCGASLADWTLASVCPRCMLNSTAATGNRHGVFSENLALPGKVTDLAFGDYVLEEEIAHGGMGVIYRARQASLNRTVAIKLLLLGRYSSAESIERFHREAQSAASLRHPNIVAIHEVGECDGQHFFSMEFVEGRSLAELLREGPLSPERAAEHTRDIAEAIHYAHTRGVLHRDLKPSNVLIDALGQVRITDFGLAKKLDGSSDLTVTGQMVGTPNYLSPEAAAGRHTEVGPASDVYSIGALFYELLTGRPPFLAGSLQETLLRIRDAEPVAPRALNSGVPVDLETICLRCLEKAPSRRYATAQELAEELQRWLRDEPIQARPASALERVAKWTRRQPLLAALLAATALAVSAALATLTVAYLRIRAAQEQTIVKAEESRHRLVRLNLVTGNKLLEEGDDLAALLWFTEAMRLDHGDAAAEEVHRRRLAVVLGRAPRLAQVWFHDAFVGVAEFSPDGRRVLTVGDDGTACVWERQTGAAVCPPIKHNGNLTFASFTANGERLVTAGWLDPLRYWDATTAAAIGEPTPIVPTWGSSAFSSGRKWLVTRMSDGAQLFETATRQPEGRFFSDSRAVQQLQFSPDAKRVAGFGTNQLVQFWEVPSARAVEPSVQLTGPVKKVSFSPDGTRLAVVFGTHNEDVAIWDLASGERVVSVTKPGGDLYDCRFSPDGRWLATASWDGSARVFDTATGLPVSDAMRHHRSVAKSVFSPDGRLLATASWDGTARLWNPATGRYAGPALHHAGYVMVTEFSSDGTHLLTGGQDQTVRLWELPANSPARLILRHDGRVTRARYSPDGRRILTCGVDKLARLWARDTGRELASLRHATNLTDAAFSPDGKRIVTACGDGSVHVWDSSRAEELVPVIRHEKRVITAEFNSDGTRIVTASDDGTARVWNATNGEAITPALQHRRPVSQAAFSPDGRRVVTASHDQTAQVWDAQTGERVGEPLKHVCEVYAAAFSADGRHVVTAASDRTQLARAAQVWDVATSQPAGPPLPHKDGVFHAAFSPNGRLIATSSEDTCSAVWDAATGQAVTRPLRHGSYTLRAAFSPDSRLLLTVSSDKSARVWDVVTGEPVTPPLRHDGQVSFGDWSPDGRELVTASEDGTARVWDVSPSKASLSELKRLAELLSAHRLHADIGMVPLRTAEIKERWQGGAQGRD